jgi:hypothetical protein
MKKYLILLIIPMMFGCSSTKILKFSQKPNEVTTTESLKSFLANNKSPKVVLRTDKTSSNLTDNQSNDYLYSVIENQLLASGFIVRDRQLFNQVIANNDNNIDYKKLKDKSDTELIIELTKLEGDIEYETNKYYNKKDQEKVEKSVTHKRAGAVVEFKIVLFELNDLAGIYKFHYTPCVDGCIIEVSDKDKKKAQKRKKNQKPEGFEVVFGIEDNVMEEFLKSATKRLVSEMRK